MPEKIIIKGVGHYRCPECGYIYASEEAASRCKAWCAKNKSCNLEIIKSAAYTPTGDPVQERK